MTGILEQIAEDVAWIKRHLMGAGTGQAQPQQVQQQAGQPLQPQAGLGVLGGAPAQPQGYPPATQEMIVQLVTPLVNDPNVKALLQAEMHAMGITALPEAQPHQYPELYARFQRVQAQVQQQQPQQSAASPASII